jgi:death on curing protein
LQTPNFLSLAIVLKIHARQIEKFRGTNGIRDQGLLESALAQPQITFDGQLLHPEIYHQAGAYLYHLTMNHPFIDGNKRTAFAVMDTFLRVNGYNLILSNEDAYNLVIGVANHQINKEVLSNYLKVNITY